jgi:23S rRNA pseudouridine2605 synthase
MERLQKIIAEAGVTSRRKAEELITAGRVKVNGEVITELGYKANPKDLIYVDGELISKEDKKYYCMYKPRSVITSVSDEFNRTTVIDLLSAELQSYRLYPVGRLDYDTKGVLLLTNDGEFMNLMVGPKSGIEKEYLARLDGIIDPQSISRLEQGVMVEGHKTLPSRVRVKSVDRKNNSCLVDITITEGKYHQIKNMLEAVGFPVKHLTRIRFGCIELGEMAEGTVRPLGVHEIKTLRELAKKDRVIKREDLSKARQY